MNSRARVVERSDGFCEAMIKPAGTNVWTRCWDTPIEVHHLLTRARGGDLLDLMKEDYHLIALCRSCHRRSDGGDAYMSGLLIEGYVVWDRAKRRPVYTGPDEYLTERYGEVCTADPIYTAGPTYYGAS